MVIFDNLVESEDRVLIVGGNVEAIPHLFTDMQKSRLVRDRSPNNLEPSSPAEEIGA